MRRGDHVTLRVESDQAVSATRHGAPRRVQAGAHGVICGPWPGGTGPDLREGWFLLAVETATETLHVPVRPEHVEPAYRHPKGVAA